MFTLNNKPTQVVVHTVTGPLIYSKYIYRCKDYKLVKKTKLNKRTKVNTQDIHYHSDRYGNRKVGWFFYKKHESEYVRASNEVYLHENLVTSYVNNLCHAWMSTEGMSEAYNQTWLSSDQVKLVNSFLRFNANIGKHFNQKLKDSDRDEDLVLDNDINRKTVDDDKEDQQIFSGMAELHRKSLSQALFNYFVLRALKERKEISKHNFGPYFSDDGNLVTYQESVENYLEYVEKCRTGEVYTHNICTEQCKRRGCGSVWSTDGLWKLSYPICMCNVSGGISEDLQSFIPAVCTNSPLNGKAFCETHCTSISQLGYPTDLKEFLKSCSNTQQSVDPDNYTKSIIFGSG